MERETYVCRCLIGHLLQPTYEHLSLEAATTFISSTRDSLIEFLTLYRGYLGDDNHKYLTRSLEAVRDPFSYFYVLAKVHKRPWKTRLIVSVSGSLLYGLGKWLDQQLQPIIRQLPTYLSSSFQLKEDLDKMAGTNFANMSIFTGNVIAMYPSINLDDAFERIEEFLHHSSLCANVDAGAVMHALRLIMKRNCFRFGDTYWLQKDGTAMGTPPAPSFATIYYGIFELDLIEQFGSSLHYLRRYIDDQFGIWIHDPDPVVDQQQWEAFKQCQETYCSLSWEFSPLSKTANFLDVTLDVEQFHITFKLYKKPLNLHLYIPPNSAHTPAVRMGLVTGGIYRILQLTTRDCDKKDSMSKFHSHLFARGYKLPFLKFAFEKALIQFSKPWEKKSKDSTRDCILLHLPFHPRDPPRHSLQQAFHAHMLRPQTKHQLFGRACDHSQAWHRTHSWNGWDAFIQKDTPVVPKEKFEPYLYELHNNEKAPIPIKEFIVAYSRAPNLKNLLFPRHVEAKCPTARQVSTIQAELLHSFTNAEPN
ncbi:unnamed protein product [Cylindrotheca closterium]|uniref:Reverse transcriptase domain-containing protein n=1 Tax=Cylindrotheca closterium TaxID=2856 RepID=A0AAD2FG96_9STRA|nr:unnamed protein product [Cylindrotheca closterium]